MRLRSGGLAVLVGILLFVHDDGAVRHPPSYFLMGRRNQRLSLPHDESE